VSVVVVISAEDCVWWFSEETTLEVYVRDLPLRSELLSASELGLDEKKLLKNMVDKDQRLP